MKTVWDIDGNEWTVKGKTAYLNFSLHGLSRPYSSDVFFDSYADFVRARIDFERSREKGAAA